MRRRELLFCTSFLQIDRLFSSVLLIFAQQDILNIQRYKYRRDIKTTPSFAPPKNRWCCLGNLARDSICCQRIFVFVWRTYEESIVFVQIYCYNNRKVWEVEHCLNKSVNRTGLKVSGKPSVVCYFEDKSFPSSNPSSFSKGMSGKRNESAAWDPGWTLCLQSFTLFSWHPFLMSQEMMK